MLIIYIQAITQKCFVKNIIFKMKNTKKKL